MEDWRFLGLCSGPGAMHMATDEAVLDARIKGEIPCTVRFYTWTPPAVTIGFFQSARKEVDLEKAKKQGVDVVRRYTGGGAVFHDKELTYSVIVKEDKAPLEIVSSYEKICGAVIFALGFLGISASFKPVNDIIVSGRKISGNAQTRRGGVILQHGTVLLGVDVKKMFSLLRVPDEKIKDKLIKTVEQRVTSLRKELGRVVGPQEFSRALRRGFEKAFNARLVPGELTGKEREAAGRLVKEKYGCGGWTLWR